MDGLIAKAKLLSCFVDYSGKLRSKRRRLFFFPTLASLFTEGLVRNDHLLLVGIDDLK